MNDQNQPPGAKVEHPIGAKVEHLIGLLGNRFPLNHFRDQAIATTLGITPEAWSNMKKRDNVKAEYLSELLHLFRLDEDYGLTYEIFQGRTLDEFKVLLAEHRVGLDYVGRSDGTRRIIRAMRNVRRNSIAFEKVHAGARGGIGAIDHDAGQPPLLHVGDKIALRITHKEDGHLLVINDSVDGEFDCLMPSTYAPDVARKGTVTRVPTGKGASRTFDVGPPAAAYRRYKGPYHIYAIWTRDAPKELVSLTANADKRVPFRLTEIEIRKLGIWLERMDALARPTPHRGEPSAESPFELHVAAYRVICPPE